MWLTRLCRYLLLPLLLAARKVPSTFTLPCCPHESLNKKSNLEVNTHTYRATSTERTHWPVDKCLHSILSYFFYHIKFKELVVELKNVSFRWFIKMDVWLHYVLKKNH